MARSTNGAQTSCSAAVGVRLPGGRQKTVLVMKTRSVKPAAASMRVEQLAGAADERRAAQILLGPRSLANDHDRRVRRAAREHRAAARPGLQRTALEGGDRRLQGRQIGGLGRPAGAPRSATGSATAVDAGAGRQGGPCRRQGRSAPGGGRRLSRRAVRSTGRSARAASTPAHRSRTTSRLSRARRSLIGAAHSSFPVE